MKKLKKDFDEKEHINRTFEIELIGLSEIRSNPINILIIIQFTSNTIIFLPSDEEIENLVKMKWETF